jgi:hypothetical protein
MKTVSVNEKGIIFIIRYSGEVEGTPLSPLAIVM